MILFSSKDYFFFNLKNSKLNCGVSAILDLPRDLYRASGIAGSSGGSDFLECWVGFLGGTGGGFELSTSKLFALLSKRL